MKDNYSVRGAVRRLREITVLDMRSMATRDLECIFNFCDNFSAPLKEELQRRNVEINES